MTALSSRLVTSLVLAFASVMAYGQNAHPLSIGASYTYVRSNILPGCSCFSLNGGSAEVQLGLTPHLALMGDATVVHKGGITPDGYTLTQLSYVGGLRFTPTKPKSRVSPFVEAAAGGANAFGSLSPSQTGFGSNSYAFAFQTGGGLEVHLHSKLTLIPVHVDYLLTTFQNGAANRQDDLRVSAGVKFRLR